ncbi:uncharacterized protein SCHCODRAFT_02752396 [Schizophyllum commune H4-8]|uniref:uncharacterized protein n=1 Tax=Schizophyllum commune (strain H4-8 / FGSC 9210) TaxID=578458 RepID=UPI00215DE8CA|nr:uncharacterized protein SCHCODRAFT_02752396 [Schizophyllum commune H4-8]KAI5886776.1 hypothetical protein SCHCODRAFT_02752396 [Schizophyllum commune H4-8]
MTKLLQDSRASLKRLAARASREFQQIKFCPSSRDLQRLIQSKIARIRINKSRASPIDRLPPEILTEVFIFAVESLPDGERMRMAMTIARVDTFWRLVARSIPHLWTSLFVESAHDMNRYRSHYINLAGDLSLRVHCATSATTLLFLRDFPSDTLHRFTSMQLASPVDIRRPWPYTQRLIHLEELTINIDYPKPPLIFDEGRDIMSFLAAPQLRSLTINIRELGFNRDLCFRHLFITLTSLTIVTDGDEGLLSMFTVQKLLPQCSRSLEKIDIDVGFVFDGDYQGQMDIMPHLAFIRMGRSGCELLRCIEAPNVTAMSFSSPHPSFARDLLSFSSKALLLSHLRRLEIKHWRGNSEDGELLAQSMGAMGNLHQLCIAGSFVPLELVRALTLLEDAPPLLPELRTLEVVDLTNEHELRDALRELYASRRGIDMVLGTMGAAL